MTFYPADAPMPAGIRTAEFLLRMLRAADAPLDYEAVMASREGLFAASGGHWPAAGFTLVDNLADLQEHEREHLAREAFTFTVLDPAEAICLGCVYVRPLARLLGHYDLDPALVPGATERSAHVDFWVRPEAEHANLDHRLVRALRDWFARDWAFDLVAFTANRHEPRRAAAYEAAGLRQLVTLPTPNAVALYA